MKLIPTSSTFLLPLLLLAGRGWSQITTFALRDINTTQVGGVNVSNRANQTVRPEDYKNRVSVYYFGKEA
jgi:hypothetical protein